ncbi:hypothetical protein [Luteolibacter sp. LG18]|uniref:hypothetical protein n=1 Tax=Luteolibacter sp. LG18 TaxID=2819286 RepID=UPI002B2AE988|nr:hypothetical protein llg_26560 [Luteolibacter sp. LG18]
MIKKSPLAISAGFILIIAGVWLVSWLTGPKAAGSEGRSDITPLAAKPGARPSLHQSAASLLAGKDRAAAIKKFKQNQLELARQGKLTSADLIARFEEFKAAGASAEELEDLAEFFMSECRPLMNAGVYLAMVADLDSGRTKTRLLQTAYSEAKPSDIPDLLGALKNWNLADQLQFADSALRNAFTPKSDAEVTQMIRSLDDASASEVEKSRYRIMLATLMGDYISNNEDAWKTIPYASMVKALGLPEDQNLAASYAGKFLAHGDQDQLSAMFAGKDERQRSSFLSTAMTRAGGLDSTTAAWVKSAMLPDDLLHKANLPALVQQIEIKEGPEAARKFVQDHLNEEEKAAFIKQQP